jgi:hypothetical protein
MPSAAATSASLFRPVGGAAMARPKAAALRVLSHPEARPWLGPSEPERKREKGGRARRGGAERENAGRAESMDIYRRLQTMLRCLLWHRGLHIRRPFFNAGVKGQDLNTVQIGRASFFC